MGTHAQTESKMNTNSDSPREIQIKICVCVDTHMPRCMLRSQFSPLAMWVLEIKFRLSGLRTSAFAHLTTFTDFHITSLKMKNTWTICSTL